MPATENQPSLLERKDPVEILSANNNPVTESNCREHPFNKTFQFKRSKSTGKPVRFLQLENLKQDPHEWEKLRELLKKNNLEIDKLLRRGAAPQFEYPPLLFSPHYKPTNLSYVDRYPFLQVLIKHVLLKNESRLSI